MQIIKDELFKENLQVLLGHSTAKMTQRYAHLSNESLMKASSCAGKLLK